METPPNAQQATPAPYRWPIAPYRMRSETRNPCTGQCAGPSTRRASRRSLRTMRATLLASCSRGTSGSARQMHGRPTRYPPPRREAHPPTPLPAGLPIGRGYHG